MAKIQRIEILRKIQAERNSFVISYITSNRQGIDVPMSMDIIRKIYTHLEHLSDQKKTIDVDLFISSNGGDGTVPWRIVTLLKEYAKKFSILVPFNAFSAATLTALGADEIVMHPMGMLGPTDATVANQFNPDDKKDPNKKISIGVEDVTAYINLIKEDVGITHEDELVQAFNKLPDEIHPLALGNAKRSIAQSRMIAKKLLTLHMNIKDEHKMEEIIDNLTSKLYYHGHPINRSEAREIGVDKVKDADGELEKNLWELYLEYENEMLLNQPFNPFQEFVKQFPAIATQNVNILNTPQGVVVQATQAGQIVTYSSKKSSLRLVYLESEKQSDYYSMDYELTGLKSQDGQYRINTVILDQEWKVEP